MRKIFCEAKRHEKSPAGRACPTGLFITDTGCSTIGWRRRRHCRVRLCEERRKLGHHAVGAGGVGVPCLLGVVVEFQEPLKIEVVGTEVMVLHDFEKLAQRRKDTVRLVRVVEVRQVVSKAHVAGVQGRVGRRQRLVGLVDVRLSALGHRAGSGALFGGEVDHRKVVEDVSDAFDGQINGGDLCGRQFEAHRGW